MIRRIADFLFPPRCFACKQEGVALCESCLRKARLSLSSPSAFITPLFEYADPSIRTALRLLKYSGRKDLATPLAHCLAKEIAKLPDYTSYVLVPIPMPTLRRFARGYNHAELLALHTGRSLSLPIDMQLLTRRLNPKRQVSSSGRREREKNQKGSFACEDASGMRIILIDDVTTTGSTLNEARTVLLSGGAHHVIAFTVAH